jgi:hypothetical protein
MPTYQFLNTETEELFEDFMSISKKEEFMKDNPHIIQIFDQLNIVSGVGHLYSKTDNSWKEVLSKVSEKHPGSELAKEYRKKTIKEVKTDQILKKHNLL